MTVDRRLVQVASQVHAATELFDLCRIEMGNAMLGSAVSRVEYRYNIGGRRYVASIEAVDE